MKLDEMKNVLKLFFQTTNEKNHALIENYLSNEIIWHDGISFEAGYQNSEIIPKEGFIKGIILRELGVPPIKLISKKINFQIAEEDKVFTHFSLNGIHIGDFYGYKATNKRVYINVTYITRFKNDLIVEMWAIGDFHQALKQIGAIK